MGIPGLLGALKSVTYPVHVSSYRGLTAGVDAYCWLHRGAFSCGTELCTGVATDRYVAFCMKRVNLLLHHGVQPVVVFDGASLPMKRNRNSERRRLRESARSKGEAAMIAGEAGAAAQHFSKAVGVTHDMAFQFIKALRQAGVRLIVAPYEADAQLAFLSRTGAVDVVITEDSDCLPYGCKKVLFKMDNEGHGQEIQLRNLAANTPLSLCNWKNSMFLDLCLLVGCDYITASIKGLGITTAHKLVDSHRSLDKIMRAVNSSKFVVPEGYWEQYKMARVTFRHHIIYNPETETTMHLMPLGDTAKQLTSLDFLGSHLQPPVAQGVSSGRLMPTNHQPYEAAAPLAETKACARSPLHGATMSPQDPTSAHPSMEAAAAGGGTGFFGDHLWNKGVEPASETNGEYGGDPVPSAEAPFSRAFIDNPFCARRPALREVPPAAPAGAGWGAASTDKAAAWATQDNHQPRVSESMGVWGARLRAEDLLADNRPPPGNTSSCPGIEARGVPSFRAREEETPWPFAPRLENEDGDRGSLDIDWRKGCAAGEAESPPIGDLAWDQPDEGPNLGKPEWGEGGEEEEGEETDVRHISRRRASPTHGEWASRVFEGSEVQGDGALASVGEPNDANQAKFVPASAHQFQSTQVSQGLETLQRRKRRLNSLEGASDWPELPNTRQPQEAPPDDGHQQDFEGETAWMIQSTGSEAARGPGGIPFFSKGKGSSHDPPAPLPHQSPTSPTRRLRERYHLENSETRVLTASSRRWTLPSTTMGRQPATGVELPLLRLLGGQGRAGGARVSQPLPKRTRGTDFWDAQLLR